MPRFRTLACIFALLMTAACGSSPDSSEEELDITVEGDDGVLTFEIRSEVPLTEGRNDIYVGVFHEGAPFTESSISATVRMASMTHGGSAPSIAALGEGEFLLHDVTLDMPGAWQLEMYAENGGQVKIRDTAVLVLEVP